MKALLCLLSGQHVPNLLSVHHFLPERLVLVESSEMKHSNAADCFLKALAIGGAHYDRVYPASVSELSTNHSLVQIANVVSLDKVNDLKLVQAVIGQAFSLAPDAEWIVNLTGGNKLMALAAHEFFKSRNARFCYVEHNTPRKLIPLDERMDNADCTHEISIGEFLAGYGFELRRSPNDLKKVESEVQQFWEASRVLAEFSTAEDLILFEREEQIQIRRKKTFELDENRLSLLPQPVRDALVAAFGLNSQGRFVLDKANRAGDFVTGGWLEVFVCGLLRRNSQVLKLCDVQRGVKPFGGEVQEPNDLDVAFIDQQLSLVMVECKSGLQEHEGARDILYKIDSVIGQSKALKARAILATTSDFLIDRERGDLTARVKQLCKLLNLTVITREQIQAMAKVPDNVELIQSTFNLSR